VIDLNDFYFFVHVVDKGGFTAAGRALHIPKSTLSHRMQQLEDRLGVRLLNRTPRHFGMTSPGRDFYQHAVALLREAELAETMILDRLSEPSGVVRCTAGVATMQFAMSGMIIDFLRQNPKVDVIAHATDRTVDIIGETFDVAVRAHSNPLPDSNLVQRNLVAAPWYLFAGAEYVATHGAPNTPEELRSRPSLFMMRLGVDAVWHLRPVSGEGTPIVMQLAPRLMSDDMVGLQKAAMQGLGIVALPSYICKAAVDSGELVRVLPGWIAGDSMLTALLPYRKGLLPSVRIFLEHLSIEFPKLVEI
jgi:DNA-binding transcriptional LysR family regulator